MDPVVVESKLTPPPVTARAVQRDRLFDDVDDGARLLAVVAPAGSGKTTACAQLALAGLSGLSEAEAG